MKRLLLAALLVGGCSSGLGVLFSVRPLAGVGGATFSQPPALSRSESSAASSPTASQGTVVQRTIASRILSRELPYLVYRPAGAERGDQRYPVLYLLHGLGADCSQWPAIGIVQEADRLIAQRVIPPMVIVMPSGEDGYWMNHRPDGPRWRDYLITEFIPLVEASEPIAGSRELRAIGGISAGGHGALQLAWNNPHLFATVGAHSPGLRTEREAFPFFGRGPDFERRDPMSLAKQVARLDLDIWIDTGDSDPWRARAEQLHQTLLERGIAHQWRPQPGGHDGAYWSSRLEDYLLFYGNAFARRLRDSAVRAATLVDPAEIAPAN
ncbi:MAG: alpha/beta hydrolase-fold protein [Chloroflexota bacterium]|nr:esterase family protein [Dehalococcoidia bacterium]MDW8254355.1 alpha/beta hydrolase-fold protein [Chloroflexota bacterium]